ncbi:low affinity immunoglobulin gamma Fc region receptor III-like [Erinaceus europaeus]|uniref:low affinity immunoglobulin gamma Fc region receptor III-like n=1 Tax=Erinaceus europaeus TaxID=9365 RepID=UPI0007A6DCF5|nr:low affinity immunoglobulin gamma Fc region receptor III-like [Erinaceus europaeus]
MLEKVPPLGSRWLLPSLIISLMLDLPKAVLHLQPPWVRVFQNDSVTLMCQGARVPGDLSTHWFHNGSSVPGQEQPSFSFQADSNDSGDYQCQTDGTLLSDPVHLVVLTDWLLLQTLGLKFQKGDPILLRCHSWRKKPVFKVIFFQNGKAVRYSRQNSDFSIPSANASHSGKYHCTGFIGKMRYSSQPVTITVQTVNQGPEILFVFVPWHHLILFLVNGVLFLVDTGLYFSVHRNLQSSSKDRRKGKVR